MTKLLLIGHNIIMSKKAKHVKRVSFNGKVHEIEVDVFQPKGHQSYSGFGVHKGTNRSSRRDHKQEARRITREFY